MCVTGKTLPFFSPLGGYSLYSIERGQRIRRILWNEAESPMQTGTHLYQQQLVWIHSFTHEGTRTEIKEIVCAILGLLLYCFLSWLSFFFGGGWKTHLFSIQSFFSPLSFTFDRSSICQGILLFPISENRTKKKMKVWIIETTRWKGKIRLNLEKSSRNEWKTILSFYLILFVSGCFLRKIFTKWLNWKIDDFLRLKINLKKFWHK